MTQIKRSAPESDQWNKLLDSVTVRDICKQKVNRRNLLSFTHTTSLGVALKELEEFGVLSAPVIDGETNSFLGFVDVLNISSYVWKTWKFDLSQFDKPNFHSHHFFNTEISLLLNHSETSHKQSIREKDSLKKLIRLFTKPHHSGYIHRVVVQNDKNEIVDVVSQSDVISWIHLNIDSFPDSQVKIRDIMNYTSPLLMVRLDTSFPDALEILCKNRVTGIAIVDDQYHMCGNFSASDMKGIGPRSFQFFRNSLMQFLIKGTKSGVGAPITCVPDDTIKNVIELLTTNQIHRVYIINESSRPVSLITMSDILPLCGVQKEPKAKKSKKRKH